MVRVVCAEDCGNAPRKQILLELNADLANGDVQSVLDRMREDVVWEVAGGERAVGSEAAREVAAAFIEGERKELHVRNIITHGWIAAVNATLTFVDGRRIEYCDVYVFAGASKTAKIKEIVSYRIPLNIHA